MVYIRQKYIWYIWLPPLAKKMERTLHNNVHPYLSCVWCLCFLYLLEFTIIIISFVLNVFDCVCICGRK